MLAEALTRMQPDSGVSSQVREIMLMIEEHGAYGLVDNMMATFGRRRLSDCSTGELTAIHSVLVEAIAAPEHPHAVLFYARGSGKTLAGIQRFNQVTGRGTRVSEGTATGG